MAWWVRLGDVRETAAGTEPRGYRLVARGVLNLGLLSVLNLAIIPPAWLGFALLTAPRGGPLDVRADGFTLRFGPLDLALVIATALLVLPVLHELAHGLVAALCGGRPVFGVGPGIAFCHMREWMGRGAYAAIVVAPLLLLSVGGVLAMPALPRLLRGPTLALLVANAAGAVGDLALLAQLARLPRGAVIADTRHGFEAYAPDGAVEGEKVEG
jgi:hypothetical protein